MRAALFVSLICAKASASKLVACVGDSITAGHYPQFLQDILGEDFVVYNNAVSGHTMLVNGMCGSGPSCTYRSPCSKCDITKTPVPQCSGNCTYWDTAKFQNTTASDPDIITIMLGTNDAKGCNWDGPVNGVPAGAGTQFAVDYRRMIKIFKALPSQPKVYVVLPPPAISLCPDSGIAGDVDHCLSYNMSFHAINEIFPVLQRQIANDAGADGVIDVWTAMNGTNVSTHITADGIHPYDPGHQIIAQTIADVILNDQGQLV